MDYIDTNKTYGEKAWLKLHKNVVSKLNKSWRQHPKKQQLYRHLPPIIKTSKVRQTRQAGHCWRSKDKLISHILQWTPSHGRAKAGWPARTYIQQLCDDTGYSLEDLPEAMNDRNRWQDRVREICADSTAWWWWWYLLSNYTNYLCLEMRLCLESNKTIFV